MRRICFGNLFLGITVKEDRTAQMEILDTQSEAKLLIDVDAQGVLRFKEVPPKNSVKKKKNIQKALKRLLDIYDEGKVVA